MQVLAAALGVMMIGGALAVLFTRSLLAAALTSGVVSLLAAIFFVLMRAYDVAITEASIGALLTTGLYFFALRRLAEEKAGDVEKEDI